MPNQWEQVKYAYYDELAMVSRNSQPVKLTRSRRVLEVVERLILEEAAVNFHKKEVEPCELCQ